MYTVIVADDEEELRSAIVERVDWASLGFSVVGQAENGAEALELVERLEPDLLLTDIKMPFISGIDLARKVREIRPAMHIAFLSGYDDFKYAQQAIQYNIISYMLKPLSLEELSGELEKIRRKMDEKNLAMRQPETEGNKEMEGFLLSLLLDGNTDVDTEKNAVTLGLKKDAEDNPQYVVLVIRLMNREGKTVTSPLHLRAVNSVLEKYVRYGSCYTGGKILSLVAENKWAMGEYLHILVNEISQSVERVLGLQCFIGVSRPCLSLDRCGTAYGEALAAVEYSSDGTSVIRSIADMEYSETFDYKYVEESAEKLERLLKSGEEKELQNFLDMLFWEMKVKKLSKADIHLLLVQLVSTVYKSVGAVADSSGTAEFFARHPIQGSLFTRPSVEDVQRDISHLCMGAKQVIAGQRKFHSQVVCDNVVEIIEKEYEDENLSLTSVSDRLHVSSNYLSALIKKTKGESFVNLLTKKRMEVAKDFICFSPLRIMEVAEKCGYSDQHYFSYCFKKQFGVSPAKMRERSTEEAGA